MVSKYVAYVSSHPPRCVVSLQPKYAQPLRPTILLPDSVYRGLYDEEATCSFVIGCPCGNRAVYLLGYYISSQPSATVFVGPLYLNCPKCGKVSEFFDTRKHGYDGEQGCNTHMIGEGEPDKFLCPRCGVMPFILRANFCYAGAENLTGEMRERMQEFFRGMDIVGQCTTCNSLVEITSFECA